MGKFDYAPGLPGYGTRGVDGSTGLSGLATYFSAYDGTTDSITIKAKIIANKILFPTDEFLSGYPDRVYQTGDEFIDKNGRVFKIDFNEVNLYVNTGQQLNTSGFFEAGTNTVQTPIYSRYSNAYTSAKFLIDVVYAAVPPGNYAANPNRTDGSIYGIGAVDFGQVFYVNNVNNGYHPYIVYTNTNDTTKPQKSIALVKEDANEAWHFGNRNGGGVVRDVSLYLDFKDLYVAGLGAKTSENLILYYNTSSKRITQGSPATGMTMNNFGVNRVLTADTSSIINAEANFIYDGIDISLGSAANILFSASGLHTIRTTFNSASLSISTANMTSTGTGGDVSIWTGSGIGSGGSGGKILIATGNGGDSTPSGGNGGRFSIRTGHGGTGAVAAGGDGGTIDVSAGSGAIGAGSQGAGGNINIWAGNGLPNSAGGDVQLLPGIGNSSWTDATYTGSVFIATLSDGTTRGQARFGNGLASFPSITFAADVNTGFFRDTADRIGVTTGGTERFRFDVSTFHADGNIVAFSSSVSDIRLKTNIEDLRDPLETVLELRGVSYIRKGTDEKHFGFIAQEVEKIIPEIIVESNLIGEPDDVLYKTIKYQEVIPYLTEAIKVQQTQITLLEEQIQYLKEEIKEIKNKYKNGTNNY
jgi:hypothetical protein